jgi:quercetin dioxygenase-like cupin family protein
MTFFVRCSSASLFAIALVPSWGLARAAELNPAAVSYKLLDQIKWSPPSPAGAQSAVLVGDPSKEGLYVQMVKWLAGNHFSHPHFHPHDRFITVLKGTWWVGTGTKFDPNATVPMPAGTFVTHYGQQVHFDGAKSADAVLFIVGEGPERRHPPKPNNGKIAAQAADLAAALVPNVAGRSTVARLMRSSTSSIEATSMQLRPLSLAR